MAIRGFQRPSWTPYWTYMLSNRPTLFFGLEALLAHKNIGIDTTIIKFELIVTDLWPFRVFSGGHLGRHIVYTCYTSWVTIIVYGVNAFVAPSNIGIDTKIIKLKLIVTDVWPFRFFGGHIDAVLEFTSYIMGQHHFYGLNAYLAP